MNEDVLTLTESSASALQIFFAYGVVLTSVILCGFSGLRFRLFKSILFFGSLVTAAVAAFAFCATVSSLLRGVGVLASWSLLAGYLAVLATTLVVMGLLIRSLVRTEVMTYMPIVDRFGGLLVGAAAGVFLASVVRVGFAMAPITGAQPSPEQLKVDVTPRVLRMIGRIFTSDPEVRRAWLNGQGTPIEDGNVEAGQIAWSEPYIDLDMDDRHDAKEPFLDKDGNGEFTRAYATGEPSMPVGVMDRYWLGNWSLVKVDKAKPGAGAR